MKQMPPQSVTSKQRSNLLEKVLNNSPLTEEDKKTIDLMNTTKQIFKDKELKDQSETATVATDISQQPQNRK